MVSKFVVGFLSKQLSRCLMNLSGLNNLFGQERHSQAKTRIVGIFLCQIHFLNEKYRFSRHFAIINNIQNVFVTLCHIQGANYLDLNMTKKKVYLNMDLRMWS